MEKIRVLIFPAGAENALEILDAIKDNVNIEVYGASGKADHAQYVYDKEHYFEGDYYINLPSFKRTFCDLLKKLSIDVLIPTHDTIALYFAENAQDYPVKILTADLKTAQICREKKKIYQVFQDCSFCPRVFRDIADILDNFPLFVKPNIGEGAKGAGIIYSLNDLQYYLGRYKKEFVIMEYLPGDEFTIDCFTDKNGSLKYCGIRTRERIQMGIAFRSRTLSLPKEIRSMAEIINKRLQFLGGWFFQVKKDANGEYKLLEVSCRIAGTMTIHRHKGINFPMLGIFEIMGISTNYIEMPYDLELDRCLHAKYRLNYDYQNVYIDYDDTITSKSLINLKTIYFLYHAKNQGKTIILLTRHEGDLEMDMEERCIHRNLFDEIIHISFTEEKKEFINPQKAIFIDNSFAERESISDTYHIPVFDVDAIDALF